MADGPRVRLQAAPTSSALTQVLPLLRLIDVVFGHCVRERVYVNVFREAMPNYGLKVTAPTSIIGYGCDLT